MKKQIVLPRQGEASEVATKWRNVVAETLYVCPNDGLEEDLDLYQLVLFRLDPPAFLLTSVRQK